MTVALFAHAVRGDPRPDAELLAHFLASRDQSAFSVLVQRHGPLVLGVCRRALGDSPDADDAFQATFLVLVSRAAGLKKTDALGPWLFGVAHRIARKLRFKRARRSRVEPQVDAMPHPETSSPDGLESDELSRAFDEELANLPEDMRRAVVLCELEGLSRAGAAKQLGISEGTLSSRLGRARKKLAEGLTKRGFGLAFPTAVVVGSKLAADTTELAAGAVVVPVSVGTLVQEALKTMTISKLKLGAAVLAAAVVCTLLAYAADKPTAKAEPAKLVAKPDPTKVVAKVGEEVVTHDEFREFVFRRNLWADVEMLLYLKAVKAEAVKRKVSVSPEELEAAVSEQLKADEGRDVTRQVVPAAGHARRIWAEHQLLPDLLLTKAIGSEAEPTEDEVKVRFENTCGERRSYTLAQIFDLPSGEVVANRPAKDAEDATRSFPLQSPPPGQAFDVKGDFRMGTCGRRTEASDPITQPEFIRTLYGIEKVGDSVRYSQPFGKSYRLTLTAVHPADHTHSFQAEKERLTREVRDGKLSVLKEQWWRQQWESARDQFYLEIAKEYDPDLYAEWKQKK